MNQIEELLKEVKKKATQASITDDVIEILSDIVEYIRWLENENYERKSETNSLKRELDGQSGIDPSWG